MIDEKLVRAKLKSVFWSEGSVLKIDDGPLQPKEILLVTDGFGSMGNYDRIHVLTNGGEHWIYMAHMVEGFLLLEETT